jgi:Zn-finger nucleic acid-binding protein
MPLLMSPIDGSAMKQVHRYGIEIDVCPTSGGIWLDRGELEKLMVLLKEDALNDQPSTYKEHPKARYTARHDHDDYDDDHYEHNQNRHGRKSKMSRVMDIFDF